MNIDLSEQDISDLQEVISYGQNALSWKVADREAYDRLLDLSNRLILLVMIEGGQ